MSSDDRPHPDKKVTAATTDAPQEEFISPVNRPSKAEGEDDREPDEGATEGAPPQK